MVKPTIKLIVMEMNSLKSGVVSYLKSENWVMTTFILMTIPLVIHTQHLILKVTGFHFDLFPYDEELYALFFAIAFDTAIITFAVNGKGDAAGGLAVVVFFLNSIFLNYDILYNIEIVKETGWQLSLKVFVNEVIAGTASFIIHNYVSFYVKLTRDEDSKMELFAKLKQAGDRERSLERDAKEIKERLSGEISLLTQEVESYKSENESAKDVIREFKMRQKIESEKQQTQTSLELKNEGHLLGLGMTKADDHSLLKTCVCGKAFSGKAFSGHVRHCKEALAIKQQKELTLPLMENIAVAQ